MVSLLKSIWLQWVAAGILLGIGFVYPSIWILGLIGGAYFIHLALNTQSRRQLYLGAWLAWTIKALASLWWFWSVYPVDWLGIDLGSMQLFIIGLYWLTSSACLGSGAVIFVFVVKLGKKLFRPALLFGVLIPFLWVGAEMFGSLMFSAFTIGNGGSITTAFSFGYVGFLLVEHQTLLQAAQIAGVYGLSFLFVVLAAGLVYVNKPHVKKYQYFALIVLSLIFVTSFTNVNERTTEETNGYSVVTIDTKFPNTLIFTEAGQQLIVDELHIAINKSLELDPDYILLPEDARFFNQTQHPALARALFQFQHQDPSSVIIDSGRVETQEGAVLQAFVYNGVEDTVEHFHKRYLVPQGEFMPAIHLQALRLFGYGGAANQVADNVSYIVGPQTSQAEASTLTPGILFCFESVDPRGVQKLVAERPNLPFVAHPISHGWFHQPELLWHQLDSMLRVQAVWNNQYIVSAGGHVAGKVYTPNGAMQSPSTLESGEYWAVRETIIPQRN